MVLILRVENGRSRFHFHCEWRRGETHPIHTTSIKFDSSGLLKTTYIWSIVWLGREYTTCQGWLCFLRGGYVTSCVIPCHGDRCDRRDRCDTCDRSKWQLNWQEGQYDDLYSCVIDTFVRRRKRRAWVLEGHGGDDHMSSMYMSWVVMWHFGS